MEWLSDADAVRAHMKTLDVARRMDEGGGFARITNFLPADVAAAAHSMLAAHDNWETMEDGEVVGRGDSVAHAFEYAEPEDFPATLGLLADAVGMLFEDLVPSFSAARYNRGDMIEPHDDKAHLQIEPPGGGRPALHSRKYAGILYLSRGWKAKFGGALLDFESMTEHVPAFNSLVVFAVPRMHGVAPVLTDRPRLSLFGWWLARGRLYDLDDDVTMDGVSPEYADLPSRDGPEVPEAPAPARSTARQRHARTPADQRARQRRPPGAGVAKKRKRKRGGKRT